MVANKRIPTLKKHSIKGGGDVALHVREWGVPGGKPILFIHAWSQSQMCCTRPYDSLLADEFRLAPLDLRGHGMSDAPREAGQYSDGDKWADDIAAVIEGLGLDRVTLVGWSYGGFVISDYVRKYGQERLAAINFAGGAAVLGEKAFFTLIGPGFLHHAPAACEQDAPTSIAAIRQFLHACFATP